MVKFGGFSRRISTNRHLLAAIQDTIKNQDLAPGIRAKKIQSESSSLSPKINNAFNSKLFPLLSSCG
jgi:hypothetical protein